MSQTEKHPGELMAMARVEGSVIRTRPDGDLESMDFWPCPIGGMGHQWLGYVNDKGITHVYDREEVTSHVRKAIANGTVFRVDEENTRFGRIKRGERSA